MKKNQIIQNRKKEAESEELTVLIKSTCKMIDLNSKRLVTGLWSCSGANPKTTKHTNKNPKQNKVIGD
jgi:ribosomal protein L37AE/L43A